jgi:hypothetical protein
MEYRNPTYTVTGEIDCEINHPHFGWIPFTASPDDIEAHGKALFSKILSAGNIAEYVPKPIPPEILSAAARAQRDQLLVESDWTDTLSAKSRLGDALYAAWQVYRQSLRDLPQQTGFPLDIAWPTKPE